MLDLDQKLGGVPPRRREQGLVLGRGALRHDGGDHHRLVAGYHRPLRRICGSFRHREARKRQTSSTLERTLQRLQDSGDGCRPETQRGSLRPGGLEDSDHLAVRVPEHRSATPAPEVDGYVERHLDARVGHGSHLAEDVVLVLWNRSGNAEDSHPGAIQVRGIRVELQDPDSEGRGVESEDDEVVAQCGSGIPERLPGLGVEPARDPHPTLAVPQAELDLAGLRERSEVEGVRGTDSGDTHLVCDADEEDGARAELFAAGREAGTGDGRELTLTLAGCGPGQEQERQ